MSSTGEIAKLRRRRGVAKGSITRIETRLATLEGTPDQPNIRDSARQMLAKLKEHDADFRKIHLAIIDLTEDEDPALPDEQAVLDEHDDLVATLTVRIMALADAAVPTSTKSVSEREILTRRCTRLESQLTEVETALVSLSHDDVCQLDEYREQLSDIKREISAVSDKLLALTPEEAEALPSKVKGLEKLLFNSSIRLKELSRSRPTPAVPAHSDSKGVKLPKLDVPVFTGNIIDWAQFWEQYCIAVHDRSTLSDAEKFVYLQQAVKGGAARSSIDGLARSGDNYKEAIECLKARYDRPRLIYKAHVKMILEAAPLKDGNGKELRTLHDTVQQHVRALKSMGYEPSAPFITSTMELKLDETTMFEWQTHSQKTTGVPHYQDLLKFLDLRAQATESHVSDRIRRGRTGQKRMAVKCPASSVPIPVVSSHEVPISALCVMARNIRYTLVQSSRKCHMPRNCLP